MIAMATDGNYYLRDPIPRGSISRKQFRLLRKIGVKYRTVTSCGVVRIYAFSRPARQSYSI